MKWNLFYPEYVANFMTSMWAFC